MSPEEAEALREAQHRCTLAEMALQQNLEEKVRDQALHRRRRYWLWMSFLPGLLAPLWLLLWIGGVIGIYSHKLSPNAGAVLIGFFVLLALAWNVFCAVKLTACKQYPDSVARSNAGCGLTLGLIFANTCLGAALAFGACLVLG